MKITSIKENRDIETNELQGYVLNNSIHIPSFDCRYKKDVEKFLNNGGVIAHAFTDEEKLNFYKQKEISELNSQRDKEVKEMKITLTIDGIDYEFDADETSQLRITRAIQILENEDDKIEWIDADGNIVVITKSQIQEGLKLAGIKQSTLFLKYAKLKEDIKNKTLQDYIN